MLERVTGFDWDEGNRAKCQKHGLSVADIEGLFERAVMVLADAAHSHSEERFRAIGTTATGRYVFLVFTIRERAGERLIRPIGARYMHEKEIRHYEEENPKIRER